MNKSQVRAVLVALAVVLIAAACGGNDNGSIEIEDARYRLARSDLGAGYLSIENSTANDVTLESVTAPGVGRIELHESLMADDGTMAMEARPDGFVIAAGETVVLEPGGKHLMIFDPGGTEDLNLSLDFGDDSIEVVARYDAEASAAVDSDDAMDDDG